MNATTTAVRPEICNCPACRHNVRRAADALFARIAFDMAYSAVREATTIGLDVWMLSSYGHSLF